MTTKLLWFQFWSKSPLSAVQGRRIFFIIVSYTKNIFEGCIQCIGKNRKKTKKGRANDAQQQCNETEWRGINRYRSSLDKSKLNRGSESLLPAWIKVSVWKFKTTSITTTRSCKDRTAEIERQRARRGVARRGVARRGESSPKAA